MVRQLALVNAQGGPTPIGPALVGIAFFGFSSELMQKAADTMCYLLCALSGLVLQAIPGITISAMRWLESFAVDHGRLLFFAQLLGNLFPLLHWLGRAI